MHRVGPRPSKLRIPTFYSIPSPPCRNVVFTRAAAGYRPEFILVRALPWIAEHYPHTVATYRPEFILVRALPAGRRRQRRVHFTWHIPSWQQTPAIPRQLVTPPQIAALVFATSAWY